MRWFWVASFIALGAVAGNAQLTTTFVGPGSSAGAGTVIPACGTGIINLSTGCTQPMLGGL